MFVDFLAVVICPGAEAKRCEWWIENMQRPAWHRHRASRRSDTRSTIARISAASSNPRSWPSENRSEQKTSSIQRSSNDHSSQRSISPSATLFVTILSFCKSCRLFYGKDLSGFETRSVYCYRSERVRTHSSNSVHNQTLFFNLAYTVKQRLLEWTRP